MRVAENDQIDKMIDQINNQFYINQLKNEISYMNNQIEYFRIKYYPNMILKIKILKEVLK